jgi:hypothetical protein
VVAPVRAALFKTIARHRRFTLGRLTLAVRSFIGILFGGELPSDVLRALSLEKRTGRATAPSAAPPARATDGALQMLAILQREARLVDFLMEDIAAYTDEQVGAAVRGLHGQCRQALERHVKLAPVIDGVEGSYTRLEGTGAEPSRVRLLGNVPTSGMPAGGTLRHKGWWAARVALPPFEPRQDVTVIAPAEVEIV